MPKPDYAIYPAVFSRDADDGYYVVTFPDVPDTISQGKTLTDAVKNAPDALGVALPDYSSYPTPTPLRDVQRAFPSDIVSLVGVDLRAARRKRRDSTVRKSVTIPQSLDHAARRAGINFSATLTEALERALEHRQN